MNSNDVEYVSMRDDGHHYLEELLLPKDFDAVLMSARDSQSTFTIEPPQTNFVTRANPIQVPSVNSLMTNTDVISFSSEVPTTEHNIMCKESMTDAFGSSVTALPHLPNHVNYYQKSDTTTTQSFQNTIEDYSSKCQRDQPLEEVGNSRENLQMHEILFPPLDCSSNWKLQQEQAPYYTSEEINPLISCARRQISIEQFNEESIRSPEQFFPNEPIYENNSSLEGTNLIGETSYVPECESLGTQTNVLPATITSDVQELQNTSQAIKTVPGIYSSPEYDPNFLYTPITNNNSEQTHQTITTTSGEQRRLRCDIQIQTAEELLWCKIY